MSNEQRNIFEIASRKKLRFDSKRGKLTVEELWDLDLESIDAIAVDLNNKIKSTETVSFVSPNKSAAGTLDKVKFDIVIHIIETRQGEQDARRERAINQERARTIRAELERRKEDSIKTRSEDDLQKELDALENQ